MAAREAGAELRNLRRGRERVDGLKHLRKDGMMLCLVSYFVASNVSMGINIL